MLLMDVNKLSAVNFASMRKWLIFTIENLSDLDKRLAILANDFDHAQVLTDRYNEATGLYLETSRFNLLAGFGAIDIVSCPLNDLESVIKCHDWYFGFFSYELKFELFNLTDNGKNATIPFPNLFFFRPRFIIKTVGESNFVGYDSELDDEISAMVIVEKLKEINFPDDQEIKPPVQLNQIVGQTDYFKAIKSLQQHIGRGDIYEVNYCMEFVAESVASSPQVLFSNMMDLSPMPFSAFLKNGEHYVICASPERYLKKCGDKMISMPMKGTSARGKQNASAVSGRVLLEDSEKEQAENIMITDLVRNDLSKVAKPGTVKVDELCGIYAFPGVYQMVSTVSCELKGGVNWAEPIRCSFPMGSMTGAPKQRALELIDVYEKGSRGLYSGAIGYISPERDYDFNVVIRSLFLNKPKQKASFWVGSAITAQSNAEDEYNECLLKANVLMKILNQ
jgi:para-aminobenzoate synthetase component 1